MKTRLLIQFRYSQRKGNCRTAAFYAIESWSTLSDERIRIIMNQVDGGQDCYIINRIEDATRNYYEVEVVTDSGD